MESRNETSNNKRKRAETVPKYMAKSHYKNKATKEQKKSSLVNQINEMILAKEENKKLVFSIEDQYTIFSMIQVLRPQLNKLKKAVYMIDTIILKDIFEGGYNERLSPNIDSFFATLLELAHTIDLSFITQENISWDNQPLLSHLAKFNLHLEKKMLILSKAFFSDDQEKRQRIIKQVLNLSPLLKAITVVDDPDLTQFFNQKIKELSVKETMFLFKNNNEQQDVAASAPITHFGMPINLFLAPAKEKFSDEFKKFALDQYRSLMNITQSNEQFDFPRSLLYENFHYPISPKLFNEIMSILSKEKDKDFVMEVSEDFYSVKLLDKPENKFSMH